MGKHRFPVNKNRAGLVFILVFCCIIPFPVLAYAAIATNHPDRLWLLFIVLLLDLPALFVLDRMAAVIEIDENGITYRSLFKKYLMRWGDIAEIGIKPVKGSYGTRLYIYSSTSGKPDNTEWRSPSHELLMFEYREPIIDAIQLYWSSPVEY